MFFSMKHVHNHEKKQTLQNVTYVFLHIFIYHLLFTPSYYYEQKISEILESFEKGLPKGQN